MFLSEECSVLRFAVDYVEIGTKIGRMKSGKRYNCVDQIEELELHIEALDDSLLSFLLLKKAELDEQEQYYDNPDPTSNYNLNFKPPITLIMTLILTLTFFSNIGGVRRAGAVLCGCGGATQC